MLLAMGAAVWVRLNYGRQRQDQNIALAEIGIITGLLLLLWCLVLSRLRWRIRLRVLGVVLAVMILVPSLFRIRGVTGDLVPILEWRWHHKTFASTRDKRIAPSSSVIPATSLTNDYPQFLGPNRNGTLDFPRLGRNWKDDPPQRLWLQPVGTAWSGFAVAGNRAITQEQRGEEEAVVCYELCSGATLWSHSYAAHYQSSLAGEGPRATPTITSNRVYALGSTGILNCLSLESGKLIWLKDIVQDNQSEVNEWGVSCSPLLIDDKVVISAGGRNNRSLVAYKAETGDFIWAGGTDGAGYSSPFLATLAGAPQILIFNSGGVAAHDPGDGKVLWKYHWPGGHPHVSTPIVLPDDRVLVSSGYGVGSELLKIKKSPEGKFTASRIWKSNRLKAKFTNLIYHEGFIYGLDDGIMACLDASNGDLKWTEGRYGHGQEILVADALLVTAESGEVILLDPNPQQPRELTRFAALKNKTWNPPALAGEYLLVRNDKEAACYKLPLLTREANRINNYHAERR